MKKVTVTFTIPQRSKNNDPLIATIPLYFPYHETISSEALYGNKNNLEKANEVYELIQPGEPLKLDYFKAADGPGFGWVKYKGKKLGFFGVNYTYERQSIENSIPPSGCDKSYYHTKLKRNFYNAALLFSVREIADIVTAKVVQTTPVSQRRKGAKYALMEIVVDIDTSAGLTGENWTIEEIEDLEP